MYKYFFKRLFDFTLSLLGIIVLAIPMIIIAIAIKCNSTGQKEKAVYDFEVPHDACGYAARRAHARAFRS